MSTLETLVVGVDGTSMSSAALVWAAERVGVDGSLLVTHARTSDGGGVQPTPRSGQPPEGDETGRDLVQSWVEPARAHGCSISTHLVDGDPAEALLTMADRVQADAIVVGPHSGGAAGRALGRVTRRLLHGSSIPVIVARAEPESDPKPSGDPGPVVACVGYGDATETAASWAADYAAQQGLRLELLHVVGYRPIFPADSPSDMLASYLGSDLLQQWAEEDLDEIRDRISIRKPELVIDTTVDVGFAIRAILKAGVGAELVVLGKRHTNVALRKMISPRIHQLIAKSATTVVAVPSWSAES